METRHEDNDGSDIFWPGYVDACTNLILNLLFLLTILIVAVFMFALELGRTSKLKSELPPIAAIAKPAEKEVVPMTMTMASIEENADLKREIERLKKLLAQKGVQKEWVEEKVKAEKKVEAGGKEKDLDATSVVPKPKKGVDESLASNFEIVVHFKEEAVALTQEEHDELTETLKPVVESGRTTIYVEIPPGFSEAKRMAFYRALAVRNLLIEMKMPTENIDVSVVEGKSNADASVVKVRP